MQCHPPVLWCHKFRCIVHDLQPVFHAHTKHNEIDFQFIRESVAMRALDVRFISLGDQPIDAFEKPTTQQMLDSFSHNLNLVGTHSNSWGMLT